MCKLKKNLVWTLISTWELTDIINLKFGIDALNECLLQGGKLFIRSSIKPHAEQK